MENLLRFGCVCFAVLLVASLHGDARRKRRCVVKKDSNGQLSLLCSQVSDQQQRDGNFGLNRQPRSQDKNHQNSIFNSYEKPSLPKYPSQFETTSRRRQKVRVRTKCRDSHGPWVNTTATATTKNFMTDVMKMMAVTCPTHQVLNGVAFESGSDGMMRCAYKCCTMSVKIT